MLSLEPQSGGNHNALVSPHTLNSPIQACAMTKKTVNRLLLTLVASFSQTSLTEARVVLSAKDHCFQVGSVTDGGWNTIIKIKPQQALTEKVGAIIQVAGLEWGSKATNPPLNYYNQMTGAGSYIPPGGQEVTDEIIQIALLGTGYGTDTATSAGVRGLWRVDYTLMLKPERAGKISGGVLVGDMSFKPIGNGHDADPVTDWMINTTVSEIPCL